MLLCQQYPGANEFFVEGNSTAVLLIHGFTGTPAEMRPIADFLHKEFGWTCFGPLLPGHGTTVQDLNHRRRSEWFECVQAARRRLNSYEQIHVIGLSMGALLSMISYDRDRSGVRSLTLLAPPLILRTMFSRMAAPLMKSFFFFTWFPWLRKTDSLPGHIAYTRYPPRGVGEFIRVVEAARCVSQIDIPTFVAISKTDQTVHPLSGEILKSRLTHEKSKLFVLEESHHVLPLAEGSSALCAALGTFYRGLATLDHSKSR